MFLLVYLLFGVPVVCLPLPAPHLAFFVDLFLPVFLSFCVFGLNLSDFRIFFSKLLSQLGLRILSFVTREIFFSSRNKERLKTRFLALPQRRADETLPVPKITYESFTPVPLRVLSEYESPIPVPLRAEFTLRKSQPSQNRVSKTNESNLEDTNTNS